MATGTKYVRVFVDNADAMPRFRSPGLQGVPAPCATECGLGTVRRQSCSERSKVERGGVCDVTNGRNRTDRTLRRALLGLAPQAVRGSVATRRPLRMGNLRRTLQHVVVCSASSDAVFSVQRPWYVGANF